MNKEWIAEIESRMSEIAESANRLIRTYWQTAKNQEASLNWKKWGRLSPRCRVGDSGRAYLVWCEIEFRTKRDGKTRYKIFKELAKGKSDRYHKGTLRRIAQDWELEMVMEYEDLFSSMRRELGYLMKLKKQIIEYEEKGYAFEAD
jgi:hypothetical protein